MATVAKPGKYYVLSPEGVPQTVPEATRPAPRVDDLRGKTIGMLDDGACGAFMQRLAEAIVARFPETRTRYWRKPSLSRPAPPEMIDEVSRNADVAIAGACV